MADNAVNHHSQKTKEHGEEKSDHGLLDCFCKKDENKKCGETDCKDEKNESLLEKLHISDSNSSSSDEECEDGEKKKKKKKDKSLKEKVEKKIEEDKVKINVKIEEAREKALELKEKTIIKHHHHHPVKLLSLHQNQLVRLKRKKGFIEKIKDKLPGGHKKAEDELAAPLPPPVEAVKADHHVNAENEHKEKKGILELIKEKLPGYHSKSEKEKKE
ncbi:hypothetical protein L1987_23674 [Smallanthus sonchifolius]|uniref:Uncharacterized protein n=1 Tax=Smallanthus sonchifolius TaxID=185202 RepID=A0ACB9IK24_9ASTR|nr:hypothetical protein L1987_23674 [Smallanthus sonchifolius]